MTLIWGCLKLWVNDTTKFGMASSLRWRIFRLNALGGANRGKYVQGVSANYTLAQACITMYVAQFLYIYISLLG